MVGRRDPTRDAAKKALTLGLPKRLPSLPRDHLPWCLGLVILTLIVFVTLKVRPLNASAKVPLTLTVPWRDLKKRLPAPFRRMVSFCGPAFLIVNRPLARTEGLALWCCGPRPS